MTKSYSPFIAGLAFAAIYFAGCSDNKPAESTTTTTAAEKPSFGGYESQVKWGEHEYCQLFRSSTIQLKGQDVSFINLTIIANVTRSGLHN